jgi:hypothetical protein
MLRAQRRVVTVRLSSLRCGDAGLSGRSTRSRYTVLGAISELPAAELDRFVHVGEADRFSVVAVMSIDGAETIVGEARYAFDPDTDSFEFGLSIDDRWQGTASAKRY